MSAVGAGPSVSDSIAHDSYRMSAIAPRGCTLFLGRPSPPTHDSYRRSAVGPRGRPVLVLGRTPAHDSYERSEDGAGPGAFRGERVGTGFRLRLEGVAVTADPAAADPGGRREDPDEAVALLVGHGQGVRRGP